MRMPTRGGAEERGEKWLNCYGICHVCAHGHEGRGGRLDLVPSKSHIIIVNFTEKSWMLYSPCPGIAYGSRKGNNRVTALPVFYFMSMQSTLRIHHPSSTSHPNAKKISHKHLYYKSRKLGRCGQYPPSHCVGTGGTCTAGSPVPHLCYHPT